MKTLLIANLVSTWILLVVLFAKPYLNRFECKIERSFGVTRFTVTLWKKPKDIIPNNGRVIFSKILRREPWPEKKTPIGQP